MHIVSSRQTEEIQLGNDIVLTIVKVTGEKVRIGVNAPAHMKVLRAELDIHPTLPMPAANDKSDIARFRKAA